MGNHKYSSSGRWLTLNDVLAVDGYHWNRDEHAKGFRRWRRVGSIDIPTKYRIPQGIGARMYCSLKTEFILREGISRA